METPPNKEIRQFIMNSFSDSTLEVFCSDYFPEVSNNFTRGMEKQTKVIQLMQYCHNRQITTELLVNLQRERPSAYQKTFIPQEELPTQIHNSIPSQVQQQELSAWIKGGGLVLAILIIIGGGYAVLHDRDNKPDDTPAILEAVDPTIQVITEITKTPTKVPTSKPSSTTTLPTNTPTPVKVLGDTRERATDGAIMVFVPGGTFAMGSENGGDDEKPVHDVTLDDFWIDKTEVTNKQYVLCVADSNCEESSYADNLDFNNDSQPVVGVSWGDAEAYCVWAGGSLPTEAEWEYAARGPEGNIFPWGDNPATCDLLNYHDGNDFCIGITTAVGSYSPKGDSWVGASDMAGNNWEWVSDWYSSDYYATSSINNPTGPSNSDYKTLCGGSWSDKASDARSSNRIGNLPAYEGSVAGFRCASPDA